MDDSNKQYLRPIDKAPKLKEFGAIDTETSGDKPTYIDGGVYVNNVFYRFNSPTDLIQFLSKPCYKSYTFFAHNATYDTAVLYKHFPDRHTLLFLNGEVYLAKIYPVKSRRFYIGDSLRLSAHIGLEKLGQAINLPKLPTPQALVPDADFLSGWSCIKHQVYQCPACYLERDTQIVYRYIDLFQKEINRLGGEMKYTLASTAMDLFRRSFLKEEYCTPFTARNDFARMAYFGGRVEPYRLGKFSQVNIYDVNSLYPYVMRNFVYPDPNYLHGPSEKQSISRIMDFEGTSEVSIEIPPMHIPPLPFRYNSRLYFPVGKVRANWTHIELRKALQMGCIIHHIHWTLWSDKTCQPFNDFVDTLYPLRLDYKSKSDTREHIIKIMLNSLYGKFAQRREAGLEKLIPFEEYENAQDKSGYDFVEYDNYIYARKPVPTYRQADYINVLWASYITAYARLTLLDYMLTNPEALLYVDTDSLFTSQKLETGKALGMMKQEHENVDIEIFAPKAYLIYTPDGQLKTKVRGIPNRYQLEYLNTHEVSYLRSIGFFEANRRHLVPAQWVEVTKKEAELMPKRNYFSAGNTGQAHQQSLPFEVADLFHRF